MSLPLRITSAIERLTPFVPWAYPGTLGAEGYVLGSAS